MMVVPGMYKRLLVSLFVVSVAGIVPSVEATAVIDYTTGHQILNIGSNEDSQCIQLPCTIRYLHSLVSGDTLESVSQGNQLCISPNGAASFEADAIPSPFTTAPVGASTIYPLYFDWPSTPAIQAGMANRLGMFYKVDYLSADVLAAKTLLENCGVMESYLYNFRPTFAAYVTWSTLLTPGTDATMATADNLNTFQIVLVGNPADLFVMINYDMNLEVTITSVDEHGNVPYIAIDGTTGPHAISGASTPGFLGGSNCVSPVAGRYVFYIANDLPVAPGVEFDCGGEVYPCGFYDPVRDAGSGVTVTDARISCPATGMCMCNTGYSGLYCVLDDLPDCDAGQCTTSPGKTEFCEDTGYLATSAMPAYKCFCESGYDPDSTMGILDQSGDTGGCSDIIDLCLTTPCKNGATCDPILESFTCTCAEGFQGSTCELELCAASPCANGGTCTDLATPNGNIGFECTCVAGWKDTRCDVEDCTAWVAVAGTCTKTAQNFRSAICGGCGRGKETRTCVGSIPGRSLERTADCNVVQCNWSIKNHREERGRSSRGRRILRTRTTCYDFRVPESPVKFSNAKFCAVKRGKQTKFTKWNCRL